MHPRIRRWIPAPVFTGVNLGIAGMTEQGETLPHLTEWIRLTCNSLFPSEGSSHSDFDASLRLVGYGR
jgi:hypothetical protein